MGIGCLRVVVILAAVLLFAGCAKAETDNAENKENAEGAARITSSADAAESDGRLQGSVQVERDGSRADVSYAFTNQGDRMTSVIGGAKYTLEKDQRTLETGGVPVKDYVDLQPGETYADSKAFANLEPGAYTIRIEWDDVETSADFVIE